VPKDSDHLQYAGRTTDRARLHILLTNHLHIISPFHYDHSIKKMTEPSLKFKLIKLAGAVEELKTEIWNRLTTFGVEFDTKTSLGIDEPARMIRSLPTLVLYDDKGLEIFDNITYHKDYYLTNSEIEICQRYGTSF
jgi:hypothetical protein